MATTAEIAATRSNGTRGPANAAQRAVRRLGRKQGLTTAPGVVCTIDVDIDYYGKPTMSETTNEWLQFDMGNKC